ncbi:unnamed protein product [Rotaria socialis]|uniref:Uncharacterized protein n=2 Tax=Rotaria socialis TaxID=392032 RepID=A0A820Q5F7_9BILA|nr:unnamed protein product [Rotaria socialis]CAF3610390.1 unnamed protein product [Rotaria socialis]CAF4415300.1 unnamed protein product [Rotaria socialis]CAF4636062.1 unnamed protein product [Rotaria socialis]
MKRATRLMHLPKVIVGPYRPSIRRVAKTEVKPINNPNGIPQVSLQKPVQVHIPGIWPNTMEELYLTGLNFPLLIRLIQPNHFLHLQWKQVNHRYFLLDDVSVVDVSAPATQLLSNLGFENSSTTATGWNQVGASCCSSNATQIITSSCNSGSNCVRYQCGPELTYSFFGQHFTATPGLTYNISFYLKATGTGGQPTFCDVNVY